MPLEVRERELPGVGVRYELDLSHDESVAIVIQNTGIRGLFYRGEGDGEYNHVVDLSDSQGRALGLLLVGAYYQPVPARVGDVTPTDERLKWYQVAPDAPAVGKTVGSLSSDSGSDGAILAVVRKGERLANPPDEFVLEIDDHIVVIGDQSVHEALGERLQTRD